MLSRISLLLVIEFTFIKPSPHDLAGRLLVFYLSKHLSVLSPVLSDITANLVDPKKTQLGPHDTGQTEPVFSVRQDFFDFLEVA